MALRGRGDLRGGAPAWVVYAYVAGLLSTYLGERVFSTFGWARLALTGLGVALVVGTTAVRWAATALTSGQRRVAERALALLSTGGAAGILLYFTTTEGGEHALGIASLTLPVRHRYEDAATVVWIALIAGTLAPMLFAERALHPMRRSANVEWRRVREALLGGLTLAVAAVYGALFTFVAAEFDVKWDFSYFHTARPSESTRRILSSATEPVLVDAFFPQLNPVGAEVGSYLRDLARGEPTVHVETYDRLLVPEVARKENVLDDGVIVITRGEQHESMTVGIDLNASRPKLKSLDIDFQKTLLRVLRARRIAYFTVGHGELNDTQPSPQNEGRTGKGVRELLERQNYAVRDLGAASGLGTDVPADASVVLVIGPEHPFLPEEVASLARYASRGGRLFLCLDPEPKVALQPLADIVGLKVSNVVLSNDHVHMRRRFNDSDHAVLATNHFSSHAAVSTLSRIASRPVIFIGAGALEPKADDKSFKVDPSVRALPDTYLDDNGNFVFDTGEKRQAYTIGAAVTKSFPAADPSKKPEEMRAFVVGDADAVSDAVFGNEANVLLFADAIRWLGGEESFAGTISTPEDVRIVHTKQKDLFWFYGTIFAAPALVLGAGLLYTRSLRRTRRSRRRKQPPQGTVDGEVAA